MEALLFGPTSDSSLFKMSSFRDGTIHWRIHWLLQNCVWLSVLKMLRVHIGNISYQIPYIASPQSTLKHN